MILSDLNGFIYCVHSFSCFFFFLLRFVSFNLESGGLNVNATSIICKIIYLIALNLNKMLKFTLSSSFNQRLNVSNYNRDLSNELDRSNA